MVVATSFRTLAIVGMSVNGAFLGICGWRVVETLRVMTALIENRVRLHLTLLMFAFCEFIYQVSLFLANGYSSWGYVFHIVALTTYIISFCLIFVRWERTLGLARSETIKVGQLAGSIVAINVAFNFIFIVLVLVDDDIILGDGKLWPLKFTRDIVECFSLLFSTVWLFAYSIHLNDNLSRVLKTSSKTSDSRSSFSVQTSKQRSIRRIVTVLFFCSLCYILRFACLLLLAIDTATDSTRADRFDLIGWFLLSNWIPTLVPGLLFLYTSRMIKIDDSKTTNALQNVFKEDMYSEYSVEDDIASNPCHSRTQPSVNIDGIDRPSEDFQSDLRSRASVESLPPGHSYQSDVIEGVGEISMVPRLSLPSGAHDRS